MAIWSKGRVEEDKTWIKTKKSTYNHQRVREGLTRSQEGAGALKERVSYQRESTIG